MDSNIPEIDINDRGKYYVNALEALIELLSRSGAFFWCNWMREDIDNWRKNKDLSHHLTAYGGMGSLNDLIICKINNHSVTRNQEPWINAVFSGLTSITYLIAHSVQRGHNTTGWIRVFREEMDLPCIMSGELCEKCGCKYAVENMLTASAAKRWAQTAVPFAVSQSNGIELVRRIFNHETDTEIKNSLEEFKSAVEKTGLTILPSSFDCRSDACASCGQICWRTTYWKAVGSPLKLIEEKF
ncbi:MAG: hypothetical protein ABIH42_10470 [Planctomycetota bacterium]